jgi:hypothetical protein
MKLRVFANATLLGLLLLPLAHAQMSVGLKGNVPFQFRIGDKTLPAGEYSLKRPSLGQQILIMRNLDAKGGSVAFHPHSVSAKSSQETKLVFHRYGRTYFLSQVWQGLGEDTGLQLVQSKAERVIAHQMAASPKHEKVELATVSFRTHTQRTD